MERDAGDWEGKGKEGIEKEGWVVKESVNQGVFVKAKKPLMKECLLIQRKKERTKQRIQ